VGLAVGDDDGGVVEEPVEEADGGGVFGKELAPPLERPVRGDAEGPAFVGGGDGPEEQLGAQDVGDGLADGVVGQGPTGTAPLSPGKPPSWRRGVPAFRLKRGRAEHTNATESGGDVE
jgi:hypothetical protein